MKTLMLRVSVSAVALALAHTAVFAAERPVDPKTVPAPEAPPAVQPKAAAAPANASPPSVAEVIVTAQRRSESVQKSSLAIEVVSAEQLRKSGVSQVTDLTAAIPGVQVGMGGAAAQIYIRGVGDFGSTAISNPAVAFNVDGVYIARPQDITGHFYDLARLEVLKGPQGTLYGRNASGGAINAIPVPPTLDRFKGDLNTEFGDYGERKFDGAVNVPLNSMVAVRGAFQVVRRDGYLSDGFDDDSHEAGRLQVLFKPNDRFSVVLAGDYSHIGGKGPGVVPIPPLAGTSPWTGITSPVVNAYLQSLLPTPPGGVPGFPPNATLFANLDGSKGFQDNTFWGVHATITADLGFATLTLVPSYRKAELQYLDYPGFVYDDGYQNPETSEQRSFEARLSRDTAKIKWVAGLYYYSEDQQTNYYVSGGLLNNLVIDANLNTISYAAFGQATYSLTDRFRLIGGLRYTSDHRSIGGQNTNIPFYLPNAVCTNPAAACVSESYAGRANFSRVTWKAGAEFDLTPKNMLFATASTGFKGGGFNANLSQTSTTEAERFNPEKLTAYEFGSRNRFFDNRLQANLELFYWDYKDHQEPVFNIDVVGNPNLEFLNAGAARQFGADIDIVARLTANDTFHIGVEYLDSKYRSFTYQSLAAFLTPGSTGCKTTPAGGPFVTADCSGFALTHAPRYSGSTTYTHRFDLGQNGSLELEGSAQFASERFLGTDFTEAERAPGYVTGNANLTYFPAKGGWSLGAFVRNLANEVVYTGGAGSPYQRGFSYGNIAPPRTYGVRASVSF